MDSTMDQTTLAYINMYAVLGALPTLCELSEQARTLLADKSCAVGFAVKGGPQATLRFANGACTFEEGAEHCDIKLPFSAPEKFNAMINGTGKPFPSKGFTKLSFLLGPFTKLTDLLSSYLKPAPGALDDENFFNVSTTLMIHVIAGAVAQIGNHDKVGRASAGYIVDGVICLRIVNGPSVGILAQNHVLSAIHTPPKQWMSYMEFSDIRMARALFDGKVNAVVCIGNGSVRVGGMVSQIDNVNRILDRVGRYLA